MATEQRLIDARFLTSQMYMICEALQTENIFIDAIIDEIDNAPTIEARPVVHGRWIHDYNNLYGCSECGERETISPKKLKNYCPNCGAQMDGGADNG